MHNRTHLLNLYLTPRRPAVLPRGRFCCSPANAIVSKLKTTRDGTNSSNARSFPANRLKKFLPSEGHQIVYVKADLLKVAGRVPGTVEIPGMDEYP